MQLWLLTTAFLAAGVVPAVACQCVEPKGGWSSDAQRQAWLMSDPDTRVFRGRVTHVEVVRDGDIETALAAVEVMSVRKGPIPKKLQVYSYTEAEACGWARELGDYKKSKQAMWFFGWQDTKKRLWVSSCTPPLSELNG